METEELAIVNEILGALLVAVMQRLAKSQQPSVTVQAMGAKIWCFRVSWFAEEDGEPQLIAANQCFTVKELLLLKPGFSALPQPMMHSLLRQIDCFLKAEAQGR